MNGFIPWVRESWNIYKYRFVPWIALNINEKTSKVIKKNELVPEVDLLRSLQSCLQSFHQYTSLRDDLSLYEDLHVRNQKVLLQSLGFSIVRSKSFIPGAGKGVFILKGAASRGDTLISYLEIINYIINQKLHELILS